MDGEAKGEKPLLGVSAGPAPATPPPCLAGPEAPPEPPTWPAAAQWTLAGLLSVGLLLVGWHLYNGSRWAARPTELESADLRLDLNRASESEIRQLPGVGEAMARRIVEERRRQGGFRTLEDLRKVSGVGPSTLGKIRHLVEVGPYSSQGDPAPHVVRGARPEQEESPPPKPPPGPGKTSGPGKKTLPEQLIDVNTAPPEELQKLPGIGPKLAAAIVAARSVKPFTSAEDLRRVRGIGPKTVDRLRPHVGFGPEP